MRRLGRAGEDDSRHALTFFSFCISSVTAKASSFFPTDRYSSRSKCSPLSSCDRMFALCLTIVLWVQPSPAARARVSFERSSASLHALAVVSSAWSEYGSKARRMYHISDSSKQTPLCSPSWVARVRSGESEGHALASP